MLRLHDDIVCRQAVSLVAGYIEGSLGRRDRRSLERHLAVCPNCSEYLAQMRATIAAAGTVEPEQLSAAARDDLVDVYKRFLAEKTQKG